MFFFSFLFGLIIGSFLNSVIYRIKTKKSIVFVRSHCPFCNKTLKWYELIPLISFVLQKGHCRYCKAKISFQYPLVELATGLIFVFIAMSNIKCQLSNVKCQMLNILNLNLWYLWFISSIFIIVFVYDYLYWEIPDSPLIFGFLIIILFKLWNLNFNFLKFFSNPLFPALVSFLFFGLIWLISKGKWMGFGDVKLGAFLGLLLGWPQIFLALFLSFGLGAILGIVLIIFKKASLKSKIPFAPFLIIGSFIALFFYQEIIKWYFSLF